ncbi:MULTISPECIES: hypothetical protein [Photorhabdus]|uniref:Uncharacterized protein n=1 Tax=Photorhabdus khanii NC19 TaxID=1004151 RepID=W3V9I0_9GAMM|nr:hypothetical protein [Photorhabdus khanii]ETS32561.1 hypothetical protein PTE_01194 [Photorhabdus khanii NC19]
MNRNDMSYMLTASNLFKLLAVGQQGGKNLFYWSFVNVQLCR